MDKKTAAILKMWFEGDHRGLTIETQETVWDFLGPDGEVKEYRRVSVKYDTLGVLRYGILKGWPLTTWAKRVMQYERHGGLTFTAKIGPRSSVELPVTPEQEKIIARMTRAHLDVLGLTGNARVVARSAYPGRLMKNAGPLPVDWTEPDLIEALNESWFTECEAPPAPAPKADWSSVHVELEGFTGDPDSCMVVFRIKGMPKKTCDWGVIDMGSAPDLRKYFAAVVFKGRLDLSSKLKPNTLSKRVHEMNEKLAAKFPEVEGYALDSKNGAIVALFKTGAFKDESEFTTRRKVGATMRDCVSTREERFREEDKDAVYAGTVGGYSDTMRRPKGLYVQPDAPENDDYNRPDDY